jgi:LuxR family transcriptional regulator, maltose regulon positive regulatory protein
MTIPILATKLYVPPPRARAVLRPRLIDRLNEGLHSKLILISAPAGFGKTTLVSEWIEEIERSTAWLSLDEGDNDPTRFLTYLVNALRTIAPTVGEGMLAVLQSSTPAPTEAMLTVLLNEISMISDKFALILDDYHVIDAPPIDNALSFLIEHLPPQMLLIITTRDDPQLPVARLRARGQLTELRASDLRFTPSETAEFLNQVMNLDLSAEDIATLETRTEGWIAGLQLAALSMQGRNDIAEFVRAFAGDNRYIVDYLVEEVLQRQPDQVRSFLLQTAILDRLNGPLCDAVTGQQQGKARLESLERGNFFVVPLDDKRHWFRYHHLFANVLYAHLMEEQPDQIVPLHRRASGWYEHNGSVSDAIRHALAAEDFERTADLIERVIPDMRRSREDATMLGWLKVLPDALVRARPILGVHFAGLLLSSGELESVEGRLQDAERWLDRTPDTRGRTSPSSAERVVVDEEEFRSLPGSIAIYRAGQSLVLGDLPATVTYARRALDLVPEHDHYRRGAAVALLGLAYWTSGDLEAAHRSYVEGMARLQRAGNVTDVIHGTTVPADIRIAQGRLREAMRTYEQALQLATEQSEPVLWGTADLHVGISELYREHNDLNAATQQLLTGKELGERTGFPQNWSRWYVAMARIREAEGDLDSVVALLHEAERRIVRDFYPVVRPIAAVRTRVWLMQGRLGEALGWAREAGLSVEDDLSYLREFEHITLVRLLLARSKSDPDDHAMLEAMRLLERLLQAAEDGGRTGSVIEILVLHALAHQIQGNITAALVPLERALSLAELEGYVRMFVDEGSLMAILLEKVVKQGITPNYVRQLLSAFGTAEDRSPANQPLIDPLSERELEVLRLLGTDLSGPEIAHELVVSLSTLRSHTKNIYTKLGVNSRRGAVRRAEELDLL